MKRRGGDVAALRDALTAGQDRVAVDQAVDVLRNLTGVRRQACGLLEAMRSVGGAELVEGGADLAGPAASLALALSAAERALAPLAAAEPTHANVELIGGVSVGLCGRFVAIAGGPAREGLELLNLALGTVAAQPGLRRPRGLRAVGAVLFDSGEAS
ncbi:hypothetical protein [Ornithinimicrobium murale]|uniref:hypothetical protein n=1 Tax=Ornithinimicrobium murale TaxID=1050153 RepID=UPI0013B472B3|nr:hypothetical protein [Ornithinimicrobium murale]